ncbi:hypothetical protein HK097_007639 [Rhizophlyctis rosea]|uniref:Uncharacterized protein n=1 Tax=Rhizophlyctis rosea TaxID=64517 RepID=A0AAD5SEG4_9FUNG|nr:hypothetical protein HK097_007639 [Rhizophlyctis rosea]
MASTSQPGRVTDLVLKLDCAKPTAERTQSAEQITALLTAGGVSVLDLIASNAVPPLLNMAQTPARTRDFSPVPSTPSDICALADAALLLLGDMASYASDLLAAEGWAVADDGAGRARYVHQETSETRPDPPKLLSLRSGKAANWCKNLLLELPAIVAPFVRGGAQEAETAEASEQSIEAAAEGELVWPARVWWHEAGTKGSHPVTVIDILDEDEEEGEDSTTRSLLTGLWQGMTGTRHDEMDVAYPPGTHLESWTSVTLAGVGIISSSGKGSILSIGLGGGIVPSFLKRHTSSLNIQCVEPNSAIASAAQKWFGFSCNPSVLAADSTLPKQTPLPPSNLCISDIPTYLRNQPDHSFPTVLLNLNINNEFPSSLISSDFFHALRRILNTNPTALVAINAGSGQEWERVATFMRIVFPVSRRLVDAKGDGEDDGVIIIGAEEQSAIDNISVETWNRVKAGLRKESAEVERMPFTLEDVKDDGSTLKVRWGGNWEDEDADGEDEEVPQLVAVEAKQDGTAKVTLAKDDPAWGLFD